MSNISELKIKREFSLILKKFLNKNVAPSLSDLNFIIKYYEYLDNITIIQNTRFGFTIFYNIYYKDKEIVTFEEYQINFNKKTMNDLVLSKTNRIRHQTNNIKKDIKTLEELEY